MNFSGHSAVTLQLISGFSDAGFEEGIRDMKPGGKRRLIIPPELGPPVSYCHLLRGRISLVDFLCTLHRSLLLSIALISNHHRPFPVIFNI